MMDEIENEDDAHIRIFQGVMVASVLSLVIVGAIIITVITVKILLK